MARLSLVVGPFASILTVTAAAFAQPATETPAPAPTTAAPAEKPVATSAAVTTTTNTATTTAPAATVVAADTGTDFSKIVKTIGIGYFGQFDLPLGVTATGTTRTVSTQLIGVRYFFSERAGIDIGVGMGLVTGSDKRDNNGTASTTIDRPSSFAMSFKAGVPLVMFSSAHYSFFFEPMALFGFAGQTIKPTTPNTANTKHNGQRIFVGGNAGALIQFGFIGIPQLTLDATIGLGLDVQGGKTEAPIPTQPSLVSKNSFSQTAFGTLTSHQPWNIFHTNVAAIYHF
jgi:hypothetical protein